MLAHGIRSYHRPTRLPEALELAAQGIVPMGGGTRLLAAAEELPNVLDLSALNWGDIQFDKGGLHLGANVTLQDVIDSAWAHTATGGLLPAACRAQSASPLLRGMTTLGGESVFAAHDSEVVAALLALNAVYHVARPEGVKEIPALRFLKNPREDLGPDGLLTSIVISGPPPGGTALERVAVLPSAPPLMSVAAALSFAGDVCVRARLALTGLDSPPARVLEAEARLEGTALAEPEVGEAVKQILQRIRPRDDAHAPASYRRDVVEVLVRRSLRTAMERRGVPVSAPRALRTTGPRRHAGGVPYFTSGRIDLTINGRARPVEAEARTTLLEVLRREGFHSVKHGCETGECGACAVLLDGRPVSACMTLALRAHTRSVQTAEGLGTPDTLHPVQQAFVDSGAIQCGYCTPAMEICAKALLEALPEPTENEVREALAGCLCRCTGYVKPVQAVLQAAAVVRGESRP